MKNNFTRIYQTIGLYFIPNNEDAVFFDRQMFSLKICIVFTFIFKLSFGILGIFAGGSTPNTNLFTIFFSCAPAFILLKYNRVELAKFFAYFPTIFIQGLSSYYVLLEGMSYGYAELALLPYITIPIFFYKRTGAFFAIFCNVALLVAIKFVRLEMYDVKPDELILDLTMSSIIYTVLIIFTYLYKNDFLLLKRNNEIIESQAVELRQLNATKLRLFSIISHDLRSPLATIKNIMQLIDSEVINPDEFKEMSKRLQKNVDAVFNMLENLLTWSLSQMEGIKPILKPFDPDAAINENLLIFQEILALKQIGLVFETNTKTLALGDEHQMNTVLRNLLSNAIKFTPVGGQIVVTKTIQNGTMGIQIRDTGVGIEAKYMGQVFSNPKLNTGTSGESGTGFGLFLCKELIEKNGGQITLKSEHGKGTTIDIYLPVAS